jgi:luciferase family oxidoreductase group 1
MLTLGALDQVPVFRGSDAQTAAQESIALAVALERFCFQRFWVAEHHGDPSRACAAPEVLAAFIAAETSTIRVGTGCVLLPYTSPLKAAETHRLLAALAPGRVDLGIGRGQGAVGATADLLAGQSASPGKTYEEQIAELLSLLVSTPALTNAHAVPEVDTSPQPWLMGSGPGGARTAAAFGLPFAFAQFAHPTARPDIIKEYRTHYRPSRYGPEPHVVVAARISCAESGIEAERLSYGMWLPALQNSPGVASPWPYTTYPSLQDLEDHQPTEQERSFAQQNAYAMITGDPAHVLESLTQLADIYATDEFVLTTACPGLPERIRAFELVALENRRF